MSRWPRTATLRISSQSLRRLASRLPRTLALPSFARMKYRRFGRTGLQMPVISCGGMRYQHKWNDTDPKEIPAPSQANLEACIHRAVELGVNHIETARGYGTSEM